MQFTRAKYSVELSRLKPEIEKGFSTRFLDCIHTLHVLEMNGKGVFAVLVLSLVFRVVKANVCALRRRSI